MSDNFIAWRDFYTVGCEELDAQHRVIIDIINDLYTAIKTLAPEESKKHIIDRLARYTESHFADEERAMECFGFPDIVEHRGLHSELTKHTLKLRDCYQDVSFSEMVRFLKEWWTYHINGEDKRYSPYIKRWQANRPFHESEKPSWPLLLRAERR